MKKKSSGFWLDLLVVALAVAIGLLLFLLPKLAPGVTVAPEREEPAPPPTLNTEVQQGRLPGYEDAPDNEDGRYFQYLFNSSVVFSEGGAPGNVLLENTVGNVCDMVVSFRLEDGKTAYRSPKLSPGEYLEYGCLLEPLSAGSYPVSVIIDVYLPPQGLPEEAESESAGPAPQEPIASYIEQATLTVQK